jgi:malate dehydrogenase
MRKVTVVGAGMYGSTTTEKLARLDLVDQVVMTDIIEGRPQGLALDMNQARPVEKYRTIVVGSNSYEDTAGSEVVVITAGFPRKPGMSRMDLLEANAKVVKQVTECVMEHSPEATLVVVTNPLDHMTTLAAEVSGLPKHKVMGQAGILDSSRFAHFISEATGEDILSVEAVTLGSHGETMVPVPSLCKVAGKPLTDVLSAGEIDELVDRTRKGGAEIVGLLKTGSAYYAPSSAAVAMTEAILTDSKAEMPVCAWLEGEYGISDVYLGVVARLGARGVDQVVELPLTADEKAALDQAAVHVKEKVEELHQVEYD